MRAASTREGADTYQRRVLLLLLAMLAARLVCAAFAPLAFDEAYYWRWSQHLAGGYYDHPPLVAIVIRLGTIFAGDTQLGVRTVPVLLGVAATWAVWRAAAVLTGDRIIAAAAALYFNLTLIVSVGTIIATPDVPLLAACAFVLFFLAKLERTGRGAWWLAVGVASGLALTAKYTALIFGFGIVVWLLMVPERRTWFASPWLWLGGAVALAVFLPVIAWNAQHGWVSFIKQFGRAVPEGFKPHLVAEYIVSQIGLATPFVFALGAMGLLAFGQGRGLARSTRVLISTLVWPVALYFVWHALHARVEGNWTAPLYPAFAIAAAVAAYAVAWDGVWRLACVWSRRLAAPVGLTIAALIYLQGTIGIIPIGRADPTARQLGAGWSVLGAEIDALRARIGAPAVLSSGYATTAWLSFYLPSRPPVVQVDQRIRWTNEPEPDPALFRAPLVYVCVLPCDAMTTVRTAFSEVEPLERIARRRAGVTIEEYAVFRLSGLRGDPLDRSPPSELSHH